MLNVRDAIEEMRTLGPLPSEEDADIEFLRKYEKLYRSIVKPITDDEARILVELFGPDGCFGMASSFVHLIESAPGWPLKNCLNDLNNEWKIELRDRAVRGGRFSAS